MPKESVGIWKIFLVVVIFLALFIILLYYFGDFSKVQKSPSYAETNALIKDFSSKSVYISEENPVVREAPESGGEVWVASSLDGKRVDVAFQTREDYERIVLRNNGFNLDLRKIQGAIAMNDEGSLIEVKDSLKSAVANSKRTICGNHLVRTFFQLDDGTQIGVGFTDEVLQDTTKGITGRNTEDEFVIVHDVFGDCDYFAIGGCGDDLCVVRYNYCLVPWDPLLCCVDENGGEYSWRYGRCGPNSEAWWFDTCWCASEGYLQC
ncbi:hypothetical protein HY450_00785 [Candidatus Pacearchaeota archaeon]|nr:hypothetical protein [Candidatus Pacearchaeota archaeon]